MKGQRLKKTPPTFYESEILRQKGTEWFKAYACECLLLDENEVKRWTFDALRRQLKLAGFVVDDPPPAKKAGAVTTSSEPAAPVPPPLGNSACIVQNAEINQKPRKPLSLTVTTSPNAPPEGKVPTPQITEPIPQTLDTLMTATVKIQHELQETKQSVKPEENGLLSRPNPLETQTGSLCAILDEWYEEEILLPTECYMKLAENYMKGLQAQADIEASAKQHLDDFCLRALSCEFKRQRIGFLTLHQEIAAHILTMEKKQEAENKVDPHKWFDSGTVGAELNYWFSERERLRKAFIEKLKSIQTMLQPTLLQIQSHDKTPFR